MGVCNSRHPNVVLAQTKSDQALEKPLPQSPKKSGPRRERLSIWKLSEQTEKEGPIGPETFMQLYNSRGDKGGFQKTPQRQSLDHILPTEEKEAQGTVMVLNCKVTIEGALSIHRQDEFEEKKVHVSGENIPEDFLSKLGLAVTCKKGLKPESPNQDDYSILIDGKTMLLGVFDGHGPFGHSVSNYIHTLLPKLISKNEQLETSPKTVFHISFDKCQKSLEMHCEHPQATFDCVISGSTASLALLRDDRIYTAHVGDSRAILSRLLPSGKREVKVLTPDHKPTLPEEKARVESCNGEVKKLPNDIPYRVFIRGRDFPGLAMSRSIGDLLCRDIGIISDPTVAEHVIREDDEFILMCSDGVWEFISNEEAVDFVGEFGRDRVTEAAEELAKKAWTKWIHQEGDVVDDITVMIAYLPKKPREASGSQSSSTQL